MQKLKLKIVHFVIVFCLLCNTSYSYAHGWEKHVADMMEVFGFERGQPKNIDIEKWMKFISSDMIDIINPFYSQLQERHPGFKYCEDCNNGVHFNHRLLFHWGYDAKPWNSAWENAVRKYCKIKNLDFDSTRYVFQQEFREEQRRRNRLINNKTEILFGFGHGGKDAMYAHFFASIAYNVHLIGDYTSSNTYLHGLQNLEDIIGLIVIEIRKVDAKLAIPIIKDITVINKAVPRSDPQKKADYIMACLKRNMPCFIRNAVEGSIYDRLKKRFRFIEIECL